MLSVEYQDGLLCPIIRCDFCGERIEDSHANVLFEMKPSQDMDQEQPYFLHKQCNHYFEQSNNDLFFGWTPLDEFILQAGFNLKMWGKAEFHQIQDRIKKARRTGSLPPHRPPTKPVRPAKANVPANGKLSQRFAIFKRDGYRCQICGAQAKDGARLEVDHKVPRSRGGSNDVSNLWTLCFECNRGKSARNL